MLSYIKDCPELEVSNYLKVFFILILGVGIALDSCRLHATRYEQSAILATKSFLANYPP